MSHPQATLVKPAVAQQSNDDTRSLYLNLPNAEFKEGEYAHAEYYKPRIIKWTPNLKHAPKQQKQITWTPDLSTQNDENRLTEDGTENLRLTEDGIYRFPTVATPVDTPVQEAPVQEPTFTVNDLHFTVSNLPDNVTRFKQNLNKSIDQNKRDCMRWLQGEENAEAKCNTFKNKYNFPGKLNKWLGQQIYTRNFDLELSARQFNEQQTQRLRQTRVVGGSRKRRRRRRNHTLRR